MLLHILTHTPTYVWAILAGLIALGMASMRAREVTLQRLLILPLAMLALSLNDIASKFGLGALSTGAWLAGCVAAGALMARFARARIAPTATPGRVLVRGSAAPLAIMMAVFFTKYAAAVMLAVRPSLGASTSATIVVCALFGVFNGILIGRLARNLADYRAIHGAGASLAA
jgi:hypothetical protein